VRVRDHPAVRQDDAEAGVGRISEHAPFGLAYAAASLATVALVSGYAASILQAGLRGALAAGGWLGGLYGLLYVLLQLEDLALLVGAFAVFVALATVMYLTRNVNWYDALSPTGSRLPSDQV
jgi:inner membrane protein